MSDMTAAASTQMESQTTRAAMIAAQHSVKATVALSATSARVSAHVAHRTAGGTVRALVAIIDAVQLVGANKREEGRVGLKQFTRLTDGKREILPIDEKAVAREFSRELRKHGVTFAIERHKDGSRTFHVEGKDATVIEHALAQASARVDERIRRAAEKLDQGEQAIETTDAHETATVDAAADNPETTLATEGERELPETVDLTDAEVTLVLDHREQTALVQALTGAPHRELLAEQIQSEGQVTLNRENAATLNTVIDEQGWTPETGDMAFVAGTVAQQHDRLSGPVTENPYLTAEPDRTQSGPLAGGDSNPFAPDEWDRSGPELASAGERALHEPEDRGAYLRPEEEVASKEPATTHQPTAGEPEAPATMERSQNLSPRDATREKVAKQINTRSEAIKKERGVGQTRTRATPRSPKVKR